jgi:hypothetical protein
MVSNSEGSAVSGTNANGIPKSPLIGRPKKADIVSKTRGHIAKRGRPPGEAAAMAEFKARLVHSPKSRKVIDKIVEAALDDDHKHQSAAWKIIADRILPLSQFEKNVGGKSAITINISGLNDATISASSDEETIEGEYEGVEEKKWQKRL